MSRKRYRLGRTCSECGATIRDDNKTGMCKPHAAAASNRDPVLRRRRAATMKRMCAPLGALRKQRLEALTKARACRDFEASKARGIHAAAMRAFNNRHLKWLPDEWRPTYKKMLNSGAYRAPEAQRIIRDQIEAERRRLEARLGLNAKCERETIDAAANAVSGSKRLLEAMRSMAQ